MAKHKTGDQPDGRNVTVTMKVSEHDMNLWRAAAAILWPSTPAPIPRSTIAWALACRAARELVEGNQG